MEGAETQLKETNLIRVTGQDTCHRDKMAMMWCSACQVPINTHMLHARFHWILTTMWDRYQTLLMWQLTLRWTNLKKVTEWPQSCAEPEKASLAQSPWSSQSWKIDSWLLDFIIYFLYSVPLDYKIKPCQLSCGSRQSKSLPFLKIPCCPYLHFESH